MVDKAVAKSASKMLVKKNVAAPAPTTKADEAVTETKEVVKAKAAEKVEAAGESIQEEEDMIVRTAKEVEQLKEDKAFKLVPQLQNDIDQNCFKLGGVLALINANGWYMDKGFDSFKSFCEADIGYRKAAYLINIYNGLVESGVKWDQVKVLGWTKLKEVAKILTPENVEQWVSMIVDQEMTTAQLIEYIKSQTAGTPTKEGAVEDAKKTTTMTFKLHSDQKETVREALDKAKHEAGTEVDSVALENICLDYLGGTSKLAKIPTLEESMGGKSAEEVLEAFGKVFPDVELSATLPE